MGCTQEQLDLVADINKAQTHYDRLKEVQHASKKDIESQFKAMRLKVHPDKNLAPGATAAFQGKFILISLFNHSLIYLFFHSSSDFMGYSLFSH